MAGLYLGSSPVNLGGVSRLCLGAEQIWPAAVAVRSTPVYRAVGQAVGSFSIPKPAGTVSGDLLIGVFFDFVPGQTLNLPSGWTALSAGTIGASLPRAVVGYKIAGASEPSAYTFSATGGSDFPIGAIFRYDTFDAAAPIGASAFAIGTASTRTIPGVTAPYANSRLFCLSLGSEGGGESITTPAGMTERYSEFTIMGFYDQAIASAGATGNRTHSQSSTQNWTVGSVLINGAPGA